MKADDGDRVIMTGSIRFYGELIEGKQELFTHEKRAENYNYLRNYYQGLSQL